jgi:hypothetical protein
MLFNPSKSNYIVFSSKQCWNKHDNVDYTFQLNGKEIPKYDNVKHLGHSLVSEQHSDVAIDSVINSFYRSVNILMAEFGNVPSKLLCKLFESYCLSLYGVVLCNFSSPSFERLCIAWRKCVRRILRIPRHSHNKLIPLLSELTPVEVLVKRRIIKFVTSMLLNDNILIKTVAQRCLYQSYSVMGDNISHLLSDGTVNSSSIYVSGNNKLLYFKDEYAECEQAVINSIKEMLDMRDGIMYNDILNVNECTELINYLCTC